jgi:hypothetical protein
MTDRLELTHEPSAVKLSERTGVPIGPTRDHPCSTCPFRLCNAGVESAYAPADAINAVWQGWDGQEISVRDGSAMICHAANDARGSKGRFATAAWLASMPEYRQCAGALVVQQREALRYHERGPGAIDDDPSRGARVAQLKELANAAKRALLADEISVAGYKAEIARLFRWARETPSRMTTAGVERVVRRMIGRPVTLERFRSFSRADVLKAAHPALADPAIGHPDLEPPRPGEFE